MDKCRREGECLIWTGMVFRPHPGEPLYGRVAVSKERPAMQLVHRVVWKALIGPLEAREQIGRTCRNTLCCEITHMFKFTSENGEITILQEGAARV